MRSVDRVRPVSRRAVLGGGFTAALGAAAGCGAPDTLTVGKDGRTIVRLLAFRAPSLGAFLPAVITAKHIDWDNGIRIDFSYTTPNNYNVEFASGNYDLGGSAALLSEALRTERGVDVTYMFNIFDYFTAVVTPEPGIRELQDLRGRRLAAATGTTNHAMFEWFAGKAGLDLSQVELLNQTPAGLSTMALMGRTDAVELWEPAYSTLMSKRPDMRSLDVGIVSKWKREFGTGTIPYLGLAAHRDWARAHPDMVRRLYRIYSEAASWTTKNPAAAAKIIAAAMPRGKTATVQELIETPERLRLNVTPASTLAEDIGAVFSAGRSTGYLSATPPSTIVSKEL